MSESETMSEQDEPTQPIAGGQSKPEPTRVLRPEDDLWAAQAPGEQPWAAGRGAPGERSPWASGQGASDQSAWASGQSAWAPGQQSGWAPPSQEDRWNPPYQPRYGAEPDQQPPGNWAPAQPPQHYGEQWYPGQPQGHAQQPPQGYAQQPGQGGWSGGQAYGYPPPHYPPQYGPEQPPYDPDQPWWHPSQPRYAQEPYYPPYQAPPARPRRTPVQRIALVLALMLAFALALGGITYLFPRSIDRASNPTQTLPPSYAPSDLPSTPTRQSADPNRPRAEPALGVSPAESAGVVLIEADTTDGIAAGSGMVLTEDGKVLTNYHVIAGSQGISVTIADSGDTYRAIMLGFDQTRDVALLQLRGASGMTTVLVDEDPIERGDPAFAVGNANGDGMLVRAAGEILDTDEDLTVKSDSPWGSEEDLKGLIQTSAGAVPGHSGGPMFDGEGEVLGMTTAGSQERRESYAIKIADAMRVVATIEAGTDMGTVRVGPAGYLGVKFGNINSVGATVTEVVAGGPADAAGIVTGSMLTRIGDTEISRDVNLANVIRALEPGSSVAVEWVAPNGTRQRADVTLGSSPVN